MSKRFKSYSDFYTLVTDGRTDGRTDMVISRALLVISDDFAAGRAITVVTGTCS